MNFLNLPQQHIIDRIIPKETLYENAGLTEKEKQYFVSSVDRVKLYYALRIDNCNIEADTFEECIYDEIVFIELKLRNLDNFDKILNIIHSSIPKPLVIVSEYEENKIISVASKTNSNNRIKVLEVFNTPKIDSIEILINLSFEKIRAKTLSTTYKNYIIFVKERIAQQLINKSNLTNIEISNDRVDEFLALQKELEILSEKMRNENQLKKRVEISLEINKLKIKIDNLRSL